MVSLGHTKAIMGFLLGSSCINMTPNPGSPPLMLPSLSLLVHTFSLAQPPPAQPRPTMLSPMGLPGIHLAFLAGQGHSAPRSLHSGLLPLQEQAGHYFSFGNLPLEAHATPVVSLVCSESHCKVCSVSLLWEKLEIFRSGEMEVGQMTHAPAGCPRRPPDKGCGHVAE